MFRMTAAIFSMILLLLAFSGSGCSPLKTYPPMEGAREFPWPGVEPVPSLISRAIIYERLLTGDERDLYVNLPPDTPAEVYERVFHLTKAGEPWLDEATPAYHVLEVRARGLRGWVDLVHSRPGRPPRFVTLTLERDVMDWRVTDRRVWRIAVDVPPPHYTPEPDADERHQTEGNADSNPVGE